MSDFPYADNHKVQRLRHEAKLTTTMLTNAAGMLRDGGYEVYAGQLERQAVRLNKAADGDRTDYDFAGQRDEESQQLKQEAG